VGIGVTPSAWATITPALQLPNGNYIGSQGSVDTFYVGQNHFYDGTNFKYVITGYATQYQLGNDNGTHQWKISPSGTAGDNITFTTAMTLNASGNLGIGTTTPSISGTSRRALTLNAPTGQLAIYELAVNGSIVGYVYANASQMVIDSATSPLLFYNSAAERMRLDTAGNLQMQAGAVMPYAPAPASISTTATLTNANIQAQIINTTGTTYTVTMPLGTTLETLATWATTNISYDFYVINTASGTITIGANSNTTLGSLTIATGVSAHFRIRRTAANTFVLYRLS
jgi:hypothetical protein